jgi:hypothetical protein
MVGINLTDVIELQYLVMEKAEKFTMGIIPENEAANFARKTGIDILEYEIHVKEELEQLQEEQKRMVQHSSDKVIQLPTAALENLITELQRLREMAWCLTAHIQDYAVTPEYRERRQAFLATGETPAESTPKDSGQPKEDEDHEI